MADSSKIESENKSSLNQTAGPLKALPIGLTSEEAEKLLKEHGENRLKMFDRVSLLQTFLTQLTPPLMILVIASLFLATVNVVGGIAIILFVILTTLIETWRDYEVEGSVISSQTKYTGDTVVLRDGVHKRLPVHLIVPGDIVFLKEGMRVPGDGIIIRAEKCMVDENAFGKGITQKMPEREIEKKFKPESSDPASIFAGTFVISGECMIRITATGTKTKYFGIKGIRQPLAIDAKNNDAIARVQRANNAFLPVVYLASLLIAVVLYLDNVPLFSAIVIAAAAAVAGTPQTILSVASSIFAMTMEKMAERVAVRREKMVDDIGKTTLICTEKLGALSRNEPTVGKLWLDRKVVDVTGEGWETLGSFNGIKNYETLDMLTEMAAVSTEADIEFVEDKRIVTGDLKEGALAVMAMKNLQPLETLRGQWNCFSRKVDDNGVRTVGLRNGKKTTFVIFGPAREVAAHCKSFYVNEKFLKIDEKIREEIELREADMAADGYETWGFAFAWKKAEPSNFVFLSLLGIYDPPKEEVRSAVELAESAGIRTVVMTHESSTTAVQFARQIGVMKPGMHAVICDELKYMKPDEKKKIILESAVFAEATSEDEIEILKELNANGNNITFIDTIGMDTRPMSIANVSITTESTNDIAKFTSECVLLNDRFANVPFLIEESRAMRQSIERAYYALFSSDLSILLTIMFGAVVFAGTGVLTALQILLVNLIADTAIGVSFSKDRVKELSIKKKTSKGFPALKEYTFALLLAVMVSVFIGALMTAPISKGYENSIVVGTLLISVITMILNWESLEESIFRTLPKTSSKTILAVSVIILIALIVLYVPVISSVFELKPLATVHWEMICLIAPLLTLLFEIKKRWIK